MARQRYHFNTDHLTLTRQRRTFRYWIYRIGLLLFLGLALGTAGYFLSTSLVKTPREKNLIAQNEKLLVLYERLNQRLDEFETAMHEIRVMDDSIYRSIVGKTPLPASMRDAGFGGQSILNELNEGLYPDVVKASARRLTQLDAHLHVQKSSYQEVMKEVLRNRNKLDHLPAIMPIKNEDLSRTGSGFGMRMHPILHIYRMHEGIDFHAPRGTEVYAAADGWVQDVRYSKTFGNVIEISHGYGILTLYAHLSKFNVRKGQSVKRGHLIGFVGSTGLSSGSHLHYEVHLNKQEVDPVNYFFQDLSSEQYNRIVAISQAYEYSMD